MAYTSVQHYLTHKLKNLKIKKIKEIYREIHMAN